MYLISNRFDALEKFKIFHIKVETQHVKVIKVVKSDPGDKYYGKHGSTGQFNFPST